MKTPKQNGKKKVMQHESEKETTNISAIVEPEVFLNLIRKLQSIATKYSKQYGRPLSISMPRNMKELQDWQITGIEKHLYDTNQLNITDSPITLEIENAVHKALNQYGPIFKKVNVIATPPDARTPEENRQVLFGRQPDSLNKTEKWIEVAKKCVDEAEPQVNFSMFDIGAKLLEIHRLKKVIAKFKSGCQKEKIISDLAVTLEKAERRPRHVTDP